MISFFQPITTANVSPVPYSDVDGSKNGSRPPPLEAVPELSELTLDNNRSSFAPSLLSSISIPHHSHSNQPSPVLITFDSSSLKRRS